MSIKHFSWTALYLPSNNVFRCVFAQVSATSLIWYQSYYLLIFGTIVLLSVKQRRCTYHTRLVDMQAGDLPYRDGYRSYHLAFIQQFPKISLTFIKRVDDSIRYSLLPLTWGASRQVSIASLPLRSECNTVLYVDRAKCNYSYFYTNSFNCISISILHTGEHINHVLTLQLKRYFSKILYRLRWRNKSCAGACIATRVEWFKIR